jgi:hypothetical protein
MLTKRQVQVNPEDNAVGPQDDVNMESPVENVNSEVIDSVEVDDAEAIDSIEVDDAEVTDSIEVDNSEVVNSEAVDSEGKTDFKVVKQFVKAANTEVDVIVIDD